MSRDQSSLRPSPTLVEQVFGNRREQRNVDAFKAWRQAWTDILSGALQLASAAIRHDQVDAEILIALLAEAVKRLQSIRAENDNGREPLLLPTVEEARISGRQRGG